MLDLVPLSLVVGSTVVWGLAAWRWMQGKPVVAYEPRQEVPWNALEVLITLCLFLFVGGSMLALVQFVAHGPDNALPDALERDPDELAIAQILAGLVTFVSSAGLVMLSSGADLRDLGWQRRPLLADARLGALAYVAIAPPVLLIQWVAVKFVPYEHPVLTELQKQSSPGTIALFAVLVIVVAPLVEELFFRVLVQGWLENYGRSIVAEETEGAIAVESTWLAAPHWPILISSAAFALMHAGHGPAPIPLFVLALALGYLYRQTHRLAPPVILHACFNATSILALLLGDAPVPS